MDFLFLCTFVAGTEKSTERTFAPMQVSLRGLFAPEERKVYELSLHGTFARVERSPGANVPRTFSLWNYRWRVETFSLQTTQDIYSVSG